MVTALPLTEAFLDRTAEAVVEDITVGEALRRSAAQSPDVLALVEGVPVAEGRREWTYRALLEDAERAARALLERVSPGEAVAIWAHNIPEWVVLQMGAALAGVTIVTVNPALREEEALHIMESSGAAVVFHVSEYRGFAVDACVRSMIRRVPTLRDAVAFEEWQSFMASAPPDRGLPRVTADDIAQIQYTSGTTGRPKGAALTHRGLVNNARIAYVDVLGFGVGERYVNPMPLFHTAGSALMVLGAIQARATHVLVPRFDPELMLDLIESERAVQLPGVPTMIRAMMQHPSLEGRDLTGIRYALSGGAQVDPSLIREVEDALGVPFVVIYAQTEASPGITITTPADAAGDRVETVGRALPGIAVKIVATDSDRVAEIGEVGEICTRGYHVMAGYHNGEAQTALAIDRDGWLHTGDLATMDARGYVRVVGRLKDMIIRGGENIYPSEVEDVVQQHPAVAEAAVVGRPDSHWGEEVVAFVRLTPSADGPSDEELTAFVKERLAPHKRPRAWYRVTEFPLTGSGKILKGELRDRALSERGEQA